jgi:integrase/recombinase XerC
MTNCSSDCILPQDGKPAKKASAARASQGRKPELKLVGEQGSRSRAPLDLMAQLRDLVAAAEVTGITPDQVTELSQKWLMDRRYQRGLSEGTLVGYRLIIERFLWFIHQRQFDECGEEELLQFFEYCRRGRDLDGGRWGHGCEGKRSRAQHMSARTVAIHYNGLRAFYNWMVKKGHLMRSPFERMEPPKEPKKEIRAFSTEDVVKLLEAAKRSNQPLRDMAVLLVLFDCGLRAAELCDLNVSDIDMEMRTIKIWHGKGDKERTVIFSPTTGAAIWEYFESEPKHPDDPAFASQRNGGRLTARGLGEMFKRLSQSAGLRGVRCSPHTMRHSFASNYLMNGGCLEDLQRAMGHTDSRMTQAYVHLNHDFMREQHRRFSPVEGLLKQSTRGKKGRR